MLLVTHASTNEFWSCWQRLTLPSVTQPGCRASMSWQATAPEAVYNIKHPYMSSAEPMIEEANSALTPYLLDFAQVQA